MSEKRREFLLKLADLCEGYGIDEISYTNDDDGIHIFMNGETIFVGYLSSAPADELRKSCADSQESNGGFEINRTEFPPSCLPMDLDKSNLMDITSVSDEWRKYLDTETGKTHDGAEYYRKSQVLLRRMPQSSLPAISSADGL